MMFEVYHKNEVVYIGVRINVFAFIRSWTWRGKFRVNITNEPSLLEDYVHIVDIRIRPYVRYV